MGGKFEPIQCDPQAAVIDAPSYAVSARRFHEVPTPILLLCVYGAWAGLTYFAAGLPWWLLATAGGYVVCLHGSLQHEAVHGHLGGTRWSTALVMWPLALWIPYTRYRTLHQAHHECPELTDPVDDPESFYWTASQWQSAGVLRRALATINQTLAGRLIIGPLLLIPAFWRREVGLIVAGDRRIAADWLVHLLAVAVVLAWVSGVCGLPVWQYLLLFAWPSASLTLLRSFAEHRPGESQDQRAALVEGSFVTRLLFLNNNLHLVHHAHPELPWYAVRKLYLARRAEWQARNGGFYFRGYWDVARRYLFRTRDHAVHPYQASTALTE